jgi:hypothetical protein
VRGFDDFNTSYIELCSMPLESGTNTNQMDAAITFNGCNSAGMKQFTLNAGCNRGTDGFNNTARNGQGVVDTSTVVTSISVGTTGGTFDNGTVYVYTSA